MQSRILVVDDEPDVANLIRQTFRKQIRNNEFEFLFAQNGNEAIKALQNNGVIDLVLTDINMPGMDGLTLLSKIKEIDPYLKSVIISAYGDMENIRTAMNRGAFDFITKPINLQDLEITIMKSITELQTLRQALKSQRELIAIQQDLKIATQIQTSILPKTYPDRKEFGIYAEMITAKEVGGDLYDFFLIDENRLGFVIGDVSGKGVPAAMFMAVTKTEIKSTAMRGWPPNECLQIVNATLARESVSGMFVTALYGILNIPTGEVTYCNAGHNYPFLVTKNGEAKELQQVNGIPLGFMENYDYGLEKMAIQSGDTLFLYTDGVTEAPDREGNRFEEDKLGACLSEKKDLSPRELSRKVIEAVRTFSANVPQEDDITVLALKYTP